MLSLHRILFDLNNGNQHISFYPNGLSVEIYDISGNLIKVLDNASNWDCTNQRGERVCAGLYFFRASDGNGISEYWEILCRKIMKNTQISICPFLVILFLLFLVSCDEGLIDPHGETKIPTPDTTGTLTAIDFPTDTGSAWTYINVDTGQEFTLRVRGTRDISGTTHRQMTISPLTTAEPDEFILDTVDHLAANAYYFRFFETDFYPGIPPILATYFTKPHKRWWNPLMMPFFRPKIRYFTKNTFRRVYYGFSVRG